MMKKLWERSEILFAVLFIILYVTGNSMLDQVSAEMGIEMVLTLPFDIILITVMIGFVKKNELCGYYGLCAPKATMREMLYYLPLLVISTVNIWFGIVFSRPFLPGFIYFFAMIATGIAEEMLFRGFLFWAMAKRNLSSAVILTSVLFGVGHIINLFNGSETELLENICQVFYAVSIGFLFVSVLLRGKSLFPCIAAHSLFNALSVFANEQAFDKYQIPVSVALCVFSLAAGCWYLKESR